MLLKPCTTPTLRLLHRVLACLSLTPATSLWVATPTPTSQRSCKAYCLPSETLWWLQTRIHTHVFGLPTVHWKAASPASPLVWVSSRTGARLLLRKTKRQRHGLHLTLRVALPPSATAEQQLPISMAAQRRIPF